MSTQKFQTRQTIESYLEKLTQANVKQGMLPLFYEVDKGKLFLFGTDNTGERDEHGICRLAAGEIAYDGAVELRGHIAEGSILTKGDAGNIRITGYVCGESTQNPARIIARDSMVSLGDTNHPERRNIINAYIEAANGITIYKRPLMHVTLISHYEDVVLRGQMMEDVSISAPYVSLSTSIGQNVTVDVEHDAVLKGAKFTRCEISSHEGEVFVSAGSIRECKVSAKYNIEFSGCVDEYTLKHARSEKGQVRHGGEQYKTGQRQRA